MSEFNFKDYICAGYWIIKRLKLIFFNKNNWLFYSKIMHNELKKKCLKTNNKKKAIWKNEEMLKWRIAIITLKNHQNVLFFKWKYILLFFLTNKIMKSPP